MFRRPAPDLAGDLLCNRSELVSTATRCQAVLPRVLLFPYFAIRVAYQSEDGDRGELAFTQTAIPMPSRSNIKLTPTRLTMNSCRNVGSSKKCPEIPYFEPVLVGVIVVASATNNAKNSPKSSPCQMVKFSGSFFMVNGTLRLSVGARRTWDAQSANRGPLERDVGHESLNGFPLAYEGRKAFIDSGSSTSEAPVPG